jgi:hypothetical protein
MKSIPKILPNVELCAVEENLLFNNLSSPHVDNALYLLFSANLTWIKLHDS